MKKEWFGVLPTGDEITKYTLTNKRGITVSISTLGAAITNLWVPDNNGTVEDIVLGYDSGEEYLSDTQSMGVLVGRNANRIFPTEIYIDQQSYQLEANDRAYNLHSGSVSMSKRLFSFQDYHESGDQKTLSLHLRDPDMGDGFPGYINVQVSYTLTDDNQLDLVYTGISNKETVMNFTNHSYFQLDGHHQGSIQDHTLSLNADYYTPHNRFGLPTGEIRRVTKSPLDFRREKRLSTVLFSKEPQIQQFSGLDHNVLINDSGYRWAATVGNRSDTRSMKIYTNQPALQVYTSNALEGVKGKKGAIYRKHGGICLEAQNTPNAVHMPWLCSSLYQGGEVYQWRTTFEFS